jgi:uroporphyrinogen-III synthase
MRHVDTRAEKHAWVLLRDRRMFGLKLRRQVPLGSYIVDYYCDELKLIVELDGGVHDNPEQARRDEIRNIHLQELGVPGASRSEWVVLKGKDVFAEEIKRFLKDRPSSGPSGHLLPGGEG